MAFASLKDLEARVSGGVAPGDKERAVVLLEDASALIASLGVDPESTDDILLENAKRVCCAMVIRSLNTSSDMVGMSRYSQTAGPYTMSFTPTNSGGDLYLTSTEKRSLGIGRAKAFSISPMIGPRHDY